MKTRADMQWREHEWKYILLLHTFPFMYLYPLPDDGRMERQKNVVAK